MWLTETEAWLTDTGGALLTNSDGDWLSDSDTVFGDMSSLPLSSALNWLTSIPTASWDDGEPRRCIRHCRSRKGVCDPRGAWGMERLQGRGRRHRGSGAMHGMRVVESAFWQSMEPLLGENALDDAGTATRGVLGVSGCSI